MVLTPQLLLNVMEYVAKKRPLESGNSIFLDIDLMVRTTHALWMFLYVEVETVLLKSWIVCKKSTE